MASIREYDRQYHKRIAFIAGFVIVAHLLAIVSFQHVNIIDRLISIGYQGKPKFEPEISIIDSHQGQPSISSKQRRAMAVENVFIVGEDKPEHTRKVKPSRKASEREVEQKVSIASPGDSYFRSYPSHAAAPYREDYVILKMVKPDYPPDAVANMQEGYVLVEAYIGVDGTVNDVYVRSAAGPQSFETATLTAVRQFLFKPVRVGGKPISFWVSFLVRFQLRR
jgi:TonB family protein